MNMTESLRNWLHKGNEGWDRFWFTPEDPATLSMIRITAGCMLLYTHGVWTIGFDAFFGPHAWLSYDIAARLQGDPFGWSHFWLIRSPGILLAIHWGGWVVFALLILGLFTRVVSVLAFLLTVSYAHREPAALFGLDQVNAMLAFYLMLGPSGGAFSLDRLLKVGRAGGRLPVEHYISANVTIRLIQLHMCIIYMFAGMSKLQGITWWNGTAMWGAIANLEYQSIDMTWLAHYPVLVAFLTHITIFWELYYCALVWPRFTRPVVVLLAIPLHLGIAAFLGMITFGTAMLLGNLAFVSPRLVRKIFDRSPTPTPSEKPGMSIGQGGNSPKGRGSRKGKRGRKSQARQGS